MRSTANTFSIWAASDTFSLSSYQNAVISWIIDSQKHTRNTFVLKELSFVGKANSSIRQRNATVSSRLHCTEIVTADDKISS
jgi:hypothetical protein